MGKIKFGVRPHAIPKRKVLMKHQKGPKAKSRTSKGVTKASKEPTPKIQRRKETPTQLKNRKKKKKKELARKAAAEAEAAKASSQADGDGDDDDAME